MPSLTASYQRISAPKSSKKDSQPSVESTVTMNPTFYWFGRKVVAPKLRTAQVVHGPEKSK